VKEDSLSPAGWIAAAALSAWACHLAVRFTTPIDSALPFVAVLVTLLAWVADPALMLATPLLIAAELALPDEGVRLLAVGAIVAVAFACAVVRSPLRADVLAVIALLLLRWIPRPAQIGRELALLVLALVIVYVLGRTPFAMAVGVAAAFFTPAFPLRTLALPLAVLVVAMAARVFGMPELRLTIPSFAAVAFALTFFAWSGLVARALPYFLRPPSREPVRFIVNRALAANQALQLAVPDGARALVLSGANVPHFRRGAVVGHIDPGHLTVRIGDVADWGYLRRETYYASHNPLPRDAAGKLRGYGYDAWLDGAGRVALPRGAPVVTVTADASLPAGASLQVEGFELAPR